MDIFFIILLTVIGITALAGIIMAIKLLGTLSRNKDKTVGEIEEEIRSRFLHLFLVITYFIVFCLVFLIASVFMK